MTQFYLIHFIQIATKALIASQNILHFFNDFLIWEFFKKFFPVKKFHFFPFQNHKIWNFFLYGKKTIILSYFRYYGYRDWLFFPRFIGDYYLFLNFWGNFLKKIKRISYCYFFLSLQNERIRFKVNHVLTLGLLRI